MVKIIQSEDPVLREISEEVPIEEIKTPKIQKVISDMISALSTQDDGAAIAAPQIGVSLRIFVISGRILNENEEINHLDSLHKKAKYKDMVFINPVLKKISKDKKLMSEGCLSVRPIYGKVRRATRATVEAYDEKGHKFTKEASGLLAHAFQHEIDHLEGVLFIDKARDMYESPELLGNSK